MLGHRCTGREQGAVCGDGLVVEVEAAVLLKTGSSSSGVEKVDAERICEKTEVWIGVPSNLSLSPLLEEGGWLARCRRSRRWADLIAWTCEHGQRGGGGGVGQLGTVPLRTWANLIAWNCELGQSLESSVQWRPRRCGRGCSLVEMGFESEQG